MKADCKILTNSKSNLLHILMANYNGDLVTAPILANELLENNV